MADTMGRVLRWLGALLGLALLLCALVLAWLWWSNRDIPIAQLEQEYGGSNLQRVSLDGVSLAYKVEGQGPPLILIHSHFYTMRQWQDWVDLLADQYTIIRFDLTSHGLTGPDPSGDYSHHRGAALLEGLMDHLGLDRAALVGSSTGGALAWHFAASRPQRTSALVLINAPGMPRITNKYMERGMPGWAGYLFYLLPEDLFKPFLQTAVIDKSLINDKVVREFHRMYRGTGNRWAEFERMRGWRPKDAAPYLEKISAPVLILWGEQNPQLPVEHVAQYRDKLTNAVRVETIIYPHIGHVIPLEIPTQSALDTRAFLENL